MKTMACLHIRGEFFVLLMSAVVANSNSNLGIISGNINLAS